MIATGTGSDRSGTLTDEAPAEAVSEYTDLAADVNCPIAETGVEIPMDVAEDNIDVGGEKAVEEPKGSGLEGGNSTTCGLELGYIIVAVTELPAAFTVLCVCVITDSTVFVDRDWTVAKLVAAFPVLSFCVIPDSDMLVDKDWTVAVIAVFTILCLCVVPESDMLVDKDWARMGPVAPVPVLCLRIVCESDVLADKDWRVAVLAAAFPVLWVRIMFESDILIDKDCKVARLEVALPVFWLCIVFEKELLVGRDTTDFEDLVLTGVVIGKVSDRIT